MTDTAATAGFAAGPYQDGRLTTEEAAQDNDRATLAAFGERSLAALLLAETGRDPRGVDLKVNYLDPPVPGVRRAAVRLVYRTRSTALVDCEITVDGRPVARVAGTYLIA